MTEKELQAAVIEAARLCGYAVHHTRPARTLRGWRTPIAGDAGFLDALATAKLSERDERTVCELRSEVADALALVQELAP